MVAGGGAGRGRRGPLWRRAVGRGFRSGWGVLVALAFGLLAAMAASGPLVAEAGANAAVREVLATVPADAGPQDAATVRIVGGRGPGTFDADDLLAALDRVPGLGPSTVTAASVGDELTQVSTELISSVGAGGQQEAARLFGLSDPVSRLVTVAGPTGPRGPRGLWLPAPAAQALGVGPGDDITFRTEVRELGATSRIDLVGATVTGVYAVAADGRTPRDVPGSTWWADRGTQIPREPGLSTLPAALLVTDPDTAAALAADGDDTLLWTAEAVLVPAVPRLAEAEATSDGVTSAREAAGQVAARVPDLPGALTPRVVSGVPEIVGRASAIAESSRARTVAPAVAGLALGGALVLAVAALVTAARRDEARLMAGLGVRVPAAGALSALEWLPIAVMATAAGWLSAVAVVTAFGPDGDITSAGVTAAAVRTAVAAASGLVIGSVIAAVEVRRAAVPLGGERRAPTPPWVWIAAVNGLAAAAVLGLVLRPVGRPAGLDLAVPLLVGSGACLVGFAVLTAALRRGRVTRRRSTGALTAPRAVASVIMRRLASPGAERAAMVGLVGGALAMVTFVAAGSLAVDRSIADKTAVLAGATVRVPVVSTASLDPTLPTLPALEPGQEYIYLPSDGSVTRDEELGAGPTRDPRLPAGDTVVWTDLVRMPAYDGTQGLLVIDVDTFAGAAAWGTDGGPVDAGRRWVDVLAEVDGPAAAANRRWAADLAESNRRVPLTDRPPVPVVLSGPGAAGRTGDITTIDNGEQTIFVEVVGVAPAFPGQEDQRVLVVAGSDSFLSQLKNGDPRFLPSPTEDGSPVELPPDPQVGPEVWSSRSSDAVVADLRGSGVAVDEVTTAAAQSVRPAFVAARLASEYVTWLAGCLAVVAVMALALSAHRTAIAARASGAVLSRIGFGRRGPLAAVVGEVGALVAAALVLAIGASALVVPLGPRLLDPDPRAAPVTAYALDATVLAAVTGLAVLAWAVAAAAAVVAWRSLDEEEVLRDAA